ncbi:hypothetical protein QFC19_002302 [Naganishia cerealis]|uniref:Uncharacterized protein n=1 Tax=Naganishia cerealis TaxID=610337 RepID=A0ACC2WBY2_9TREE|nr:hypothetical protein QFC19_002302 [Naganishia cerealis]
MGFPAFRSSIGSTLLRPFIRQHQLPRAVYSTATAFPPTPAVLQLSRLRELLSRLGSTNKPLEKQAVIAEYPDLRELLEHIYDPHTKHHVTSAKLAKTLSQTPKATTFTTIIGDPKQTTLKGLLNALSSRKVTGNAAVEAIQTFLHASKILPTDGKFDPQQRGELSLQEVFMRVLDKNLKAGIAAKTLKDVQWGMSTSQTGAIAEPEITQSSTKKAYGESHTENSQETSCQTSPDSTKTKEDSGKDAESALPVLEPPTRLAGFSCALGKTVLRNGLNRALPLSATGTSSSSPVSATFPRWLASRKLDGVRLLVVMDVFVPHTSADLSTNGSGAGQLVKVLDMWTLSRSGKEYYSLDILKSELARALSGSEYISNLLAYEPRYAAPRDLAGQGYNQRLVLDGELCHLTYDTGITAGPEQPVREDFAEVVSMVRRKEYTIQQPAMFLLDVLPWSVFLDGMSKHGDGTSSSYKVFVERVKDCDALVKQVAQATQGTDKQPVLRHLHQTAITSIEQVEEMIEEAAEKAWEGLILRRGDQPYEGRRRQVFLPCTVTDDLPIPSSSQKFSHTEIQGMARRRIRSGINRRQHHAAARERRLRRTAGYGERLDRS